MAFINLSQLTKAVKGLVNKINLENYIISDKLGNLSNLDTSDKSNLVAAINEVMDNSTTNYTQLTNKPSINNVTLSGNKTASDLGLAPAGAYVKPSNGIPKTDLASGVQASLDLADTALQSYTETDPTVPAWAKAATKPTYTASEVGALPSSTVIPSKTSDLTNDSGYVNAQGAAAVAPVQSVNGQTGTVSLAIPSSASDVGALPDTTLYAGAGTAGGPATVTNGIHYAHVNSTSTSTVFTATVTGVTELYDGLTILLKNGVVTSASGFTININNLGAKPVYNSMAAAGRETTIFNVNYTLLLIYDSTRVNGGCWINYRGYYTDSNTVPTGYCTTAAGTAAKSATCNYGYRDDDNYFPCLFRYANTAANATLAIASYATTAAPIYVNGARTSSSNTFGCGVILFLYHNGGYYCYNDGRFPILVDGAVTSVQEYVATKYTKPSGGIPKTDLASAVQTSLGKADTALQSVPSTYRTAAAQDAIDDAQDTAISAKYTKPSGGIPASDLDLNSQSAITTAERLKQGLNGEGFVWAYTENDELYFNLVDSGDLAPRTLFLNLDSTETIVSAQYTAADLMAHYQARPTVWWLLDKNKDLVAVLYPTYADTTTGKITFSSTIGTTVYDVSIHPDPDDDYKSMIGTLVKHQILTPEIGDVVTYDLKQALLQLAQKIAYIDDGGQTYYKALYDALFPPQPAASITAVYTQSGTVWSDDDLDNLKADLTVTAIYADGSSSAPIDPEDYTLSGSLDAASSTVTVSYTGKTTTFPVTVTMVGDTEYASDVRNFRLSSESGSSGMGADYLWLKCVSSSMISSYTSWAFDCKKTLWNTVKGKRLRVRASLMSPDWTGDPGAKNCILASFAIFSSAGITGGSGRQKWHRFDNLYNLPSEYTTYEFVFDATLDNMDGGSGTPTANSTCGLVLFSQTLNELRCNACSVREVLST